MQVKEIQQLHRTAFDQGPQSALESLTQLEATVRRSLESLKAGHTPQAQMFLENSFTQMMMAFHFLNLNLEHVVKREKARREGHGQPEQDRVILVFSDHAELRVGGELRGTIPLYSEDDYRELREIAQLFQCRVEQAHHIQLDLFSILSRNNDG